MPHIMHHLDAGKRVERSRTTFSLRVISGQRSNLQERLSESRIELSAGFSERSGNAFALAVASEVGPGFSPGIKCSQTAGLQPLRYALFSHGNAFSECRTMHNRGPLKQVTRTNNSRLREGRPRSHKDDLSLADRAGSTSGLPTTHSQSRFFSFHRVSRSGT